MATLDDDGKSQERASAVLRELCGYLVQQVHIGRTVHVPNLGLFFGGPGKMHFKVEKIARGAGVHKELAEELLQTMVKDFWAAIQESPEVELDLPGVGKIKVQEKTLTFEAFGTELPRAKVTAEHQMFSRTAGELWSRMPQSQHSLRSKAEEAKELKKSTSTPVLKPLNHEARVNGEVSFPSSFKDRKLASLKEDAEAISKRFTRQLPVSDRLFPPILDRCSRTRAALFRESVNRDHISNVIGSNYSPHSRSLTIDHEAHASLSDTLIRRKPEPKTDNQDRAQDVRNLDWTAEWPAILEDSPVAGEIEAVQMSKKEFCRILCRYRHYTEAGVPAEVLAPYHRQWLEHAVLLLEFENASRWPMLGPEEQNKLIEELRHEILKGYIRAAKSSMVNYALLDDRSKKRLDVPFIPSPPPVWGDLVFEVPDIGTPGGPPQQWRAGLQQARTSLANRHVQNSATALRLVDFWLKECQEVRLVNLPGRHADFCDIKTFFAAQSSMREMGLQELSNNWQQVIQIVSEEPQYLLKDHQDPRTPSCGPG